MVEPLSLSLISYPILADNIQLKTKQVVCATPDRDAEIDELADIFARLSLACDISSVDTPFTSHAEELPSPPVTDAVAIRSEVAVEPKVFAPATPTPNLAEFEAVVGRVGDDATLVARAGFPPSGADDEHRETGKGQQA